MTASATSTFPASIDVPQAPIPFDNLATPNVEHDLLHDWAQDAIKKIEARLGITSSPDVTSIDYVLKNHQHQGTDRSAQIARLPIKMVASQTLAPVEVQNNLGTTLSAITSAGEFLDIGATAATLAVRSYVTGDTNDRFQIQADGKILWGPGNTTLGTAMYRTGVGQLRIDNQLGIGMTPTMALDVTGSARFSGAVTLGGGLSAPLPIAQGGTGSITQNFVDLTAAQTVAGLKTLSAGLSVTGSPNGYGAPVGEVTGGQLALTTTATGAPRMYFDHRGATNTGDWVWRNGTGAASSKMTLDGTGVLAVVGSNQYFGPYATSVGVGIRARMLFGADVVFMSESDATTADVGMIIRPKGAGTVQLQNSASSPVVTAGISAGARSLGFFGGGPITKPAVTGSRSANAALASLLTQLANFGLITDSTTA